MLCLYLFSSSGTPRTCSLGGRRKTLLIHTSNFSMTYHGILFPAISPLFPPPHFLICSVPMFSAIINRLYHMKVKYNSKLNNCSLTKFKSCMKLHVNTRKIILVFTLRGKSITASTGIQMNGNLAYIALIIFSMYLYFTLSTHSCLSFSRLQRRRVLQDCRLAFRTRILSCDSGWRPVMDFSIIIEHLI